MSEPPPYLTENTYVADPNDDVEIVRLVLQDRFLTMGMGGLFPERSGLAGMQSLLDVACGPGGWALQVAQTYPQIEVTGVDLSIRMMMYARAQALVHEISNVRFRLMNVLKPLDFPDGSFDLVNGRLLFAFLSPATWPALLQECFRILRPGGVLRLTEGEFPITNSPAVEAINAMTTQAFQVTGRSFSPDGRSIGITPMLGRLLREAGYRNIQRQAHALDYSTGTESHDYFASDYRTSFQVGQQFLIKSGVTSQEAFEPLYQQALQELWRDDFQALQFFLTVWGERPA
jgi:ubiquinone/menaquinone biosynthesis C-methylase UbiE